MWGRDRGKEDEAQRVLLPPFCYYTQRLGGTWGLYRNKTKRSFVPQQAGWLQNFIFAISKKEQTPRTALVTPGHVSPSQVFVFPTMFTE